MKCVKEPDNLYDGEAIKVAMKEIGIVGYVANSAYTVAVGTMSAGRIYDKVGRKFRVEVMFITASQVICRVVDEKVDKNEKDYENFDDVVVSDNKRKDLSDR